MFSISIFTRAVAGLGVAACAACAGCAGTSLKSGDAAPPSFYTVTAEIALARHEPHVAAVQYAAAAATAGDPALLERATQVAMETLQPSLAAKDAARWISVDPRSLEAQRAAAKAALSLHKIEQSAAHYRIVLGASPAGTDAEFGILENDLAVAENVFGARQLADRLAALFPASASALRVQGFAALRADDPAAAVRSFTASLAMRPDVDADAQRDVIQALARARILAGDVEAPLSAARLAAEREDTPANRFDYVLLLMTAQRNAAAMAELETLARSSQYAPVALRLSGLLEFQQGHLDAATLRFAELLRTKKYPDDAFYYLGLIADRRDDAEHALRLYAQVQQGENAVPALLRATTLLHKNGASAAAEELLDRLVEDEPQRAPEILTARSRMYADAGDLPRALALLQQAVAQYPDSVDLRYAMASIYEEQGRISDALHELNGLLKARPDDPAALNALGYTLADHARELPRARRLIERAYSAAPKNAAILDSLGWVLFRQGHGEQAETYLRAAYMDDRGGDIAAHLGEVLWRLGRQADAEHVWMEAGAIDTDNRLLNATRQRLNAAGPNRESRSPR